MAPNEEYAIKEQNKNIKFNVFELIHITPILIFEVFGGGINSKQVLDILKKKEPEIIKASMTRNMFLMINNCLVHKNTNAK